MKILFFLGFSNPFPSAGWTRIGFFAKHFKDRGYNVTIIGVFSPKSLKIAGFRSWKSVPIYNVIPTLWAENISSLMFNVLSSIILAPIIFLALRPKIVILSLPTGEPAIGAYLASKLIHARVVFDVRDEWEDSVIGKVSSKAFREVYKLLKALMTSLYNKGDLVVTVTRSVARSLRLRGVRKVEVVPNGADIKVFRPYGRDSVRGKLGLKNDEFVIVYEGGVGGYYRLDVVIRAIARLDNAVRSKIRLLIVGPGDMLNILSLAENFCLKDNVVYLGVKNDKVELAQIISAGDVGIVPYDDNPLWKNSLPAKFYEYCACGIPVIATVYDDSLLANIIKEHEVGLTTPPVDDEKLSEAILWIYQNAQSREAMGRRARMLIEEKFDRNKIADKFLRLIEECASNE
jgi:glycosyltransferase involved in cell wall biosynthesis